jgi:hypothetical protein
LEQKKRMMGCTWTSRHWVSTRVIFDTCCLFLLFVISSAITTFPSNSRLS